MGYIKSRISEIVKIVIIIELEIILFDVLHLRFAHVVHQPHFQFLD